MPQEPGGAIDLETIGRDNGDRSHDTVLSMHLDSHPGTTACWYDTRPPPAVVHIIESDTEAVKALVAAAKTGRFDHVAQQLRDRRDEQARIDAYAAELDAAGITVLQEAEVHHDHTEYVQHLLD